MIKINLLKENGKSKKIDLEPKEEVLTSIKEIKEVESPQNVPLTSVNREELQTVDNFDDVMGEKETPLVNEPENFKKGKDEVESIELKEKISNEQIEMKNSPFRPIKFDAISSEGETVNEPIKEEIEKTRENVEAENEEIELNERKETTNFEKTNSEKDELSKASNQNLETKDAEIEDEKEFDKVNNDKPKISFRVVESSIEEDDEEVTFEDFTSSKMPHILVAIAILAIIGVSGYYLWTMNDDLAEPIAKRTPAEEIPTEVAATSERSKIDPEISSILEENEFEFEETSPVNEKPVEKTKISSETTSNSLETATNQIQNPPNQAPSTTTFTNSANVNFKEITLPNALILKREFSSGEFKITCFSQKKFTRGVVEEFKKRGGYSQLNINVRTEIRDGQIGDLIIFTGKN